MSTFKELGVTEDYIKGLKELGIKSPTEIQEKTIPVLLNSKTDLIGLAQTGTGKTAAFGIPVLQAINPENKNVQALILSPTRELVQQIKKQLFKFTKYVDKKIFVEAVFGGEKIDKQISSLRRTTHIIVATPGRLADLLDRREISLDDISTLILDEADEMLSMGFKNELNRILRSANRNKNTWLFSATMPDEIRQIIKKYMSDDAVKVTVENYALINENINHQYFLTSIKNKTNAIIKFLDTNDGERGIIFCRTKAGTQKLAGELKEEGFSAEAIEGDMQQKERDKVMRAFKNRSLQILVSTDVSARGIDVHDLAFVIHHQLPEQLEYYTHRSGRTARAGKSGLSLAMILPSEMDKIREIEKKIGISFTETIF